MIWQKSADVAIESFRHWRLPTDWRAIRWPTPRSRDRLNPLQHLPASVGGALEKFRLAQLILQAPALAHHFDDGRRGRRYLRIPISPTIRLRRPRFQPHTRRLRRGELGQGRVGSSVTVRHRERSAFWLPICKRSRNAAPTAKCAQATNRSVPTGVSRPGWTDIFGVANEKIKKNPSLAQVLPAESRALRSIATSPKFRTNTNRVPSPERLVIVSIGDCAGRSVSRWNAALTEVGIACSSAQYARSLLEHPHTRAEQDHHAIRTRSSRSSQLPGSSRPLCRGERSSPAAAHAVQLPTVLKEMAFRRKPQRLPAKTCD